MCIHMPSIIILLVLIAYSLGAAVGSDYYYYMYQPCTFTSLCSGANVPSRHICCRTSLPFYFNHVVSHTHYVHEDFKYL